MSDSFAAIFTYRGQRFAMELRYGRMMIFASGPAATAELLNELATHIDNYRTVWPTQLLWAFARYFFLPLKAQPQHTA